MTSTERIRQKYDEIADRYENIFFYVADAGQQLVDYADPERGTRVLDVGAGRGAVARAALARGCIVTAIDASAGMVERLGSDYPEITARQMDAGQLNFADSSFDLVTAGFVVQVLDNPAAALAEIRRVLAPAGLVALSLEKQSVGRLQWLHQLHAEFFQSPDPADTAVDEGTAEEGAVDQDVDYLTDQKLDTLLAEGGFVNLMKKTVEMPLSLPDPQALWNWLVPQGLTEILRSIPDDRSAEFRRRFFLGAEHMHTHGGIVLEFSATLHLAHAPR
ncbi:MAG: class I SAM-dependent methyltransferase [Pseudonocardiaceae bacterium]